MAWGVGVAVGVAVLIQSPERSLYEDCCNANIEIMMQFLKTTLSTADVQYVVYIQ